MSFDLLSDRQWEFLCIRKVKKGSILLLDMKEKPKCLKFPEGGPQVIELKTANRFAVITVIGVGKYTCKCVYHHPAHNEKTVFFMKMYDLIGRPIALFLFLLMAWVVPLTIYNLLTGFYFRKRKS